MARPKTKFICDVKNCGRPYAARGFCRRHLNRYYAQVAVKPEHRCRAHGCKRKKLAKGWCMMHYHRVRIHGSPGSAKAIIPYCPRLLKGRNTTSNGYHRVKVAATKQWVLEHRHVMEKKIGRPLHPDESVHHRDGDRTNNKPKNLELWVRCQPIGARVKDSLKWAREIIRRYG